MGQIVKTVWRAFSEVILTFGALACILVFIVWLYGLKPEDVRGYMHIGWPGWAWLICGLFLFAVSLWSSGYSLYVATRKHKAEISTLQRERASQVKELEAEAYKWKVSYEEKSLECRQAVEKLKEAALHQQPAGDVLSVELEPTKGKADKQVLVVTNKGKKQNLRAQCQILDDGKRILKSYPLSWESGAIVGPLSRDESGNLVIAIAGQDRQNELNYIALRTMSGGQWESVEFERWNFGEKPTDIKFLLNITVIGEETQTSKSGQFIVRPGTSSALEMVAAPSSVNPAAKCPHLLSYEGCEPFPGYYVFPSKTLTMQIVAIRNSDLEWPVTANNVIAKIEYRHKNGRDVFVVPEAMWIAPNVSPQLSGPQSRILIAPNDVARLAVVGEDNSEAKKKWVITRLDSSSVKELTAGRWDLKITITADNCDPYIGTGGFTIKPDGQIQYDDPEFRFAYE